MSRPKNVNKESVAFYLRVSLMQESQISYAISEVVAEGDRKIYRRDCEIAPDDECTEGGGGGGVIHVTYVSPFMFLLS